MLINKNFFSFIGIMENSSEMTTKQIEKIIIVPHTHWDREWYLPFQNFRQKLVQLIDNLIEILDEQEYYFMLDGQTIVLEDYFEIRPENKEKILKYIREGRLAVGPWYILPDEWLVGEESLIRNLEMSFDIAKELNIKLMDIAYLPDQFGHTRTIPQLLSDLTNFRAAVLWRGVGNDVVTVPFNWKSHSKSKSSIFTVYMPHGYGNAASLTGEPSTITEEIRANVDDLLQFSPVPVYLLMNGTDHQFPNPKIIKALNVYDVENSDVDVGLLDTYVNLLKTEMNKVNYHPPTYIGEFRSSARAPLLQDTYSARMWIKQWNQKIEDLLTKYAEPINVYLEVGSRGSYPSSYLNLAWKWLLKNHPHDSICGCSIDQVHEEMKARFYWAESLATSTLESNISKIENTNITLENSLLHVFNSTNSPNIPMKCEFTIPANLPIKGLLSEDGREFGIQSLSSSEDIIFEEIMNPFMVRSGMKMLPGRKLVEDYLNEIHYLETADPEVCEIRLIFGKEPIGDFDVKEMKSQANELLDSKKYKKYHIKATRGSKQTYCAMLPLKPFSFSKFTFLDKLENQEEQLETFTKDMFENQLIKVDFKKDGSLIVEDKVNDITYSDIHFFEDYGDRGDEYTFGKVSPEYTKASNVKRKILSKGPLFYEIEQKLELALKKELNKNRNKRNGLVKVPIKTIFRFYRDSTRIDMKTTLTNLTSDHRLRICFDTPFYNLNSLTSTHFGVVSRKTEPVSDESYVEAASGIQAQKRFIRLDDFQGKSAITLSNRGLPEVEVVEGKRLALTLIRSVGFLSRSDFPERPLHAGPFLETPGAQEINQCYEFDYSIVFHSKEDQIYKSSDYAEVCTLDSTVIITERDSNNDYLTKSIIGVNNPWIRISSIRMKNKKTIVTLYNLSEDMQNIIFDCNSKFKFMSTLDVKGEITKRVELTSNNVEVSFNPFEIKIFEFE